MDQAVIFDFNGVLLDDERIHLALFNEALAPLGYALSEAEYFDRYVGFDDADCFRHAVADRGGTLDDGEVARLIDDKAACYLARMERDPPLFPGAAAVVRSLARHHRLAICSGALRQEVEQVLAAAALTDCFAAVVAAEDVAHGKPDPEGYVTALAALNRAGGAPLAADACLVVEDTVAGIAAAKGAGMRCLAVTHTYPRDRLGEADQVVTTLAEVTPAVVAALLR